MSYRTTGAGRPVLLLHGNPTSSWLWRHVLHEVGQDGVEGRWVAPDLIGMGASAKPDLAYRLSDHVAHVDAFIDALDLDELIVVGHDWGVAIALDLCRRRRGQIRGVAVMEGHLRPLPDWTAFDDGGRELFQQLRTPGVGERMVLEENFFLDTLLPAALVRPLPAADLSVYREPYPDPASRRPLLQWARQIPVSSEPADVAASMQSAIDHFGTAQVPVLLVHGEPGVLVTADTIAWCRQHLPHLDVVDVGGPAGHFLPEDRPQQLARALVDWASAVR